MGDGGGGALFGVVEGVVIAVAVGDLVEDGEAVGVGGEVAAHAGGRVREDVVAVGVRSRGRPSPSAGRVGTPTAGCG